MKSLRVCGQLQVEPVITNYALHAELLAIRSVTKEARSQSRATAYYHLTDCLDVVREVEEEKYDMV